MKGCWLWPKVSLITVWSQLAWMGLEGVRIICDSIRQCVDKTSQWESGWAWIAWRFCEVISVNFALLTHSLQQLLQFKCLFLTEFVSQLLRLQLFLLVFLLRLCNGSVQNRKTNYLGVFFQRLRWCRFIPNTKSSTWSSNLLRDGEDSFSCICIPWPGGRDGSSSTMSPHELLWRHDSWATSEAWNNNY